MTDTTYGAMTMSGPGVAPELVERPIPEPRPDEAIIRVYASSMNYHDLVNLMGLIHGPWPRVPMSDGAGEVVAVGIRGPLGCRRRQGDRGFPPRLARRPPHPAEQADDARRQL